MTDRGTIRRYVDGDAEALTELLHRAYAELGARGLNFTGVDQNVKTTRYRTGLGTSWVIESNGALVATLTMTMPPSPTLQTLTAEAREPGRVWLNQMAVDPTLRGTGLASQLWEHGLDWARGSGATSVGVDTATSATHLIALYERWGFTAADTIHWPGKTYDSTVMIRPEA